MTALPKDFRVFPEKSKRRPDREVILLLHGAGGKTQDWTYPMWRHYNYAYWQEPKKRTTCRDALTAPLDPGYCEYSLSPNRPIHNWKDFLVGLGHTVITYSQAGSDKKVEVCLEELKSKVIPYIEKNVLKGKLKDCKVTIIAHSRGGLLISKYLHDVSQEKSSSWIKKVITIQSPHRGTNLPYLNDLSWLEAALVGLTGDFTIILIKLIKSLLIDYMITECHDELEPTSALIRSLDPDVSPNPNIEFHTIGGTSVELSKVYSWVWAPESYVPTALQKPSLTPLFDWVLEPVELKPISPILNDIPDVPGFSELHDGEGDMLVTDASARLGYSKHKSMHINHAEGLWHPELMEYISGLLGTPAKPMPIDQIRYYANLKTKQFHDLEYITSGCSIDHIKNGVLLDTNDADEIKAKGYDGCYYCNIHNHKG